jgi:hypothetical protein
MDNTDKKNQHYIPKFYLRNFSYQNNDKQIGLYNLNTEFFYSTASLKHQGSRNFFYGIDGKIEDALSHIEPRFASLLKKIIQLQNLPKANTLEQLDLLFFVGVTDLRNPVRIENTQNIWEEMKRKMKEISPNNQDGLPKISHEKAVELSLSNIRSAAELMLDLSYKLLINETHKPFISSDFPVVKYNQYQESNNAIMSKCGYASLGLQIFIPISPRLLLVLYDPSVYKVGNKKDSCFVVNNENDVSQFNILQFINCIENVYFNEQADIAYIKGLHQKASRFPKSNIPFSHGNKPKKGVNEKGEETESSIIMVRTTDCDIKLNVQGIKVHSGAKGKYFDRTRVLVRPKIESIIKRRRKK